MSHELTERQPPADDQTLLDRIRSFIADAADKPIDSVGRDTDFYEELGMDSLGAVSVFIDMAYEFGVPEPPPDTDFATLNTATKLVRYVRTRMPASLTAGQPGAS